MPRYFRMLQSLIRRLQNRRGEKQSPPAASQTMTSCPRGDLEWVGTLSKAHRQPWYLLLNPNRVATPSFLEQLLTAQHYHAENADRSFHAWIAEQALIIELRDNKRETATTWELNANRKADDAPQSK